MGERRLQGRDRHPLPFPVGLDLLQPCFGPVRRSFERADQPGLLEADAMLRLQFFLQADQFLTVAGGRLAHPRGQHLDVRAAMSERLFQVAILLLEALEEGLHLVQAALPDSFTDHAGRRVRHRVMPLATALAPAGSAGARMPTSRPDQPRPQEAGEQPEQGWHRAVKPARERGGHVGQRIHRMLIPSDCAYHIPTLSDSRFLCQLRGSLNGLRCLKPRGSPAHGQGTGGSGM